VEAIHCWPKPASGGAVILLRWGLPRDARGSYVSGRKRPSVVGNPGKPWEDTQPEAAEALRRLAEAHAQQDPTFRTTLASTRLTAKAALAALPVHGYREDQLPSPSTMAAVLNRLGFRLRKVVKAKPHKKMAETDAMFANMEKKITRRSPRCMSNA